MILSAAVCHPVVPATVHLTFCLNAVVLIMPLCENKSCRCRGCKYTPYFQKEGPQTVELWKTVDGRKFVCIKVLTIFAMSLLTCQVSWTVLVSNQQDQDSEANTKMKTVTFETESKTHFSGILCRAGGGVQFQSVNSWWHWAHLLQIGSFNILSHSWRWVELLPVLLHSCSRHAVTSLWSSGPYWATSVP